jgi:cob(I)alamin adenosyltransferase
VTTSKKGLGYCSHRPGKGKTTAALGLGFRAVGQGLRVLMVQFIKGSWHYGELDAAEMLNKAAGEDRFKILPMGRGFVKIGAEKPDPEDVRLVDEAWNFASSAILSGEYPMVILDEINYAISDHMLDAEKVAETLRQKPEMVHVVLTGRNAHPAIAEFADLVTEMREVKHPYQKGIVAERGIAY